MSVLFLFRGIWATVPSTVLKVWLHVSFSYLTIGHTPIFFLIKAAILTWNSRVNTGLTNGAIIKVLFHSGQKESGCCFYTCWLKLNGREPVVTYFIPIWLLWKRSRISCIKLPGNYNASCISLMLCVTDLMLCSENRHRHLRLQSNFLRNGQTGWRQSSALAGNALPFKSHQSQYNSTHTAKQSASSPDEARQNR